MFKMYNGMINNLTEEDAWTTGFVVIIRYVTTHGTETASI